MGISYEYLGTPLNIAKLTIKNRFWTDIYRRDYEVNPYFAIGSSPLLTPDLIPSSSNGQGSKHYRTRGWLYT